MDAFAGTGTRLDRDGSGAVEVLPGSALKALEVDPPFNRYVFIEVDPAKAEELQGCIPVEFAKIVEVIPGDANDHMKSIATGWNRKTDRGTRSLATYVLSRLRSIFKGGVQNRTLVLKNSKNSPMFLLIFCLANPGDKARALAMKGVQEILNKHAKEGGDVATFGD